MRSILNKFKRDNSGVALLSVMITLTVCLLIASIALEITYNGLLSRKVNQASEENFYSSEAVVDDIQTVLQGVSAYAADEFSKDVVSGTYMSNAKTAVVTAAKALQTQKGGSTSFDIMDAAVGRFNAANITTAMSDYLFENLDEPTKQLVCLKDADNNPVYWLDASGTPHYTRDANKFKVNYVYYNGAKNTGKLSFNITLNYTDEKGYLTNITTDIAINDVTTHGTPASSIPLGSYSSFNGSGIKISSSEGSNYKNNKKCFTFFQEGNTYVGTIVDGNAASGGKDGVSLVVECCDAIFDGERVIFNGDVYIKDGVLTFSKSTGVIDGKGKIYIDENSALVLASGCNLLCQDIRLLKSDGTDVSAFDGTTYLKNNSGAGSYAGVFPYSAGVKLSDIKNDSNLLANEAHLQADFLNRNIGGCVMVLYNQESAPTCQIADLSNRSVGAAASVVVNKNDAFVPEALTTIYYFDGTTAVADPELSYFVNMPLVYWQYRDTSGKGQNGDHRVVTNAVYDINNAYNNVKGTYQATVTDGTGNIMTVYPLRNSGGKTLVSSSSTSLAANSASWASATFSAKNNTTAVDSKFSGMVLGAKTIDGSVSYGYGRNNPVVSSGFALYVTYASQDAKIQLASNGFVGLFINGKYVSYEINSAGTQLANSILSVKKTCGESSTQWTQIQNYVYALSTVSYFQDSLIQVSNGFISNDDTDGDGFTALDLAYAMESYNSCFRGGVYSLINDGSIAGDTSAPVNFTGVEGMYDVITINNWKVNG